MSSLIIEENPCTSCGSCCTAPVHDRNGVNLIGWVTAAERARLPADAVVMASPFPGMPDAAALAATDTRCVKLAGVVGMSCTCTIYDARPKICRDLEVGDERCTRARARLGKPPIQPLSLYELVRRGEKGRR